MTNGWKKIKVADKKKATEFQFSGDHNQQSMAEIQGGPWYTNNHTYPHSAQECKQETHTHEKRNKEVVSMN